MYTKLIYSLLPKEIVKVCKLSDQTTFRIGGKATIVFPRSEEEFVFCLRTFEENEITYRVLGNGSNILAGSGKHEAIYICPIEIEKKFVLKCNCLKASAGANINEVIMFCQSHGVAGLENLFGIPASVGGMIAMNASAFGCGIYDHISKITVFEKGLVRAIDPKDVLRSNHFSEFLDSKKVIISAEFALDSKDPVALIKRIREVSEKRALKQPKGNSAGCVFRNPEGDFAGRLIDQAGLKGKRVGKAFVSDIHANFIISEGASSNQVEKLIEKIQKTVLKKTGVVLEPEIQIMGEKNEINK